MGAWVPILEGSERENARAVVLEIARALEAFLERPIESLDPAERGSLSSGYPGLALFFGHAARALERDDFRDLALAFLNETFAHWPETAPLYGGRTGVAWALAHLSWLDPRVEEPLRSLDENLGKLLEKPWPGHFDLIAGLAGISVYALERLPRAGARACLARALEHLASSALESEGALAWPTPAPLYGPVELEVCPSRRGLVNLGVAHGVPGVLAVLSLACARGVMRERLSPLVERAVSYVLGRELEGSLGFPHFVVPGRKPKQRGRSAWCYGDLG
ncbi:hypothetical protein HY251_14445, partial [bacterium]|nr:hypothetical protein [bacterium]